MDAEADKHRKAVFAMQLHRATKNYLPVRFLALASTSQIAVSRPPIDNAGKMRLYNAPLGWAHDFSIRDAIRLLCAQGNAVAVEAV